MIDIFTKKTGVMESAFKLMDEKLIYDRASAMLWFYFVIVAAIMALVLAVYNRFCMKKWN